MSIRRYVLALLLLASPAAAQTPFVLTESVAAERSYAVRANLEAVGALTLPAEKAKTGAKSVKLSGRSVIVYDERVLTSLPDGAGRSLRVYQQAEFKRSLNDQSQETTIRPGVRRMVVIRRGSREVPFSPDGPLTFGEIDFVRTDVFTPALAGMLPNKSVTIGERWPAAAGAIEELTDFERVEQGGLECRLASVVANVATVAFSGTVRGVSEDGPVCQEFDGQLAFDLNAKLISGLTLTGIKTFQDRQGKTTGRIEGRFTLTRKLSNAPELSDAALRGLTLEPNSTNTLLVYEGSGIGVRFTYPRRWRISAEHGRQITLDAQGNGLLITIEPADKVPSAAEYLGEANDFVRKQKGRVVRAEPPTKLRPAPHEVEGFGLDIEMDNRPARMEYLLIRQPGGGATMAARLQPTDAAALKPEVEMIGKSLQIGPAAPIGVVPLPNKK